MDASALTPSSTDPQMRPFVPVGALPDLPVLWLDGPFTASDTYDMDLARLVRPTPSAVAGSASAWPSFKP